MERKRILILGGANVHCKLVRAAKEMGLYTIVTDYLVDSPAKLIADKSYMYDVNDVDAIVEMCLRENVEAVISTHLDPCQRPYQKICARLGLPCFGTEEQFFKLTDKHAFKQMCKECGVDVIQEYSQEDIFKGTVIYPVFVKPVDSRGSRGQSVCYTAEQTLEAIRFAVSESSNGDILIEKYMAGANEVQVTYFLVDGEAYLVRTVDSYRGSEQEGLEKVVLRSISPSKYTDEYLAGAHKNVVRMIKQLGIKNGPVFMQGFYDEGKFRFFDPGLRFPGVDYEEIYGKVFGVDLLKCAISYAVTGEIRETVLPKDSAKIKGKAAAVLFPAITEGKIAAIEGIEELCQDERVVSFLQRHFVGEQIGWTRDVNQRLAEVDVLSENEADLQEMIQKVWDLLRVQSEEGKEMLMQCRGTDC